LYPSTQENVHLHALKIGCQGSEPGTSSMAPNGLAMTRSLVSLELWQRKKGQNSAGPRDRLFRKTSFSYFIQESISQPLIMQPSGPSHLRLSGDVDASVSSPFHPNQPLTQNITFVKSLQHFIPHPRVAQHRSLSTYLGQRPPGKKVEG
jgi:hypothetical protein